MIKPDNDNNYHKSVTIRKQVKMFIKCHVCSHY